MEDYFKISVQGNNDYLGLTMEVLNATSITFNPPGVYYCPEP